jgi:hypothetical protein
MNGKRTIFSLVIILLILISSACGIFQVALETPETGAEGVPPDQVSPSSTTGAEEPAPTIEEGGLDAPATIRHEFRELGISLDVPAELYVRKEPIVNYDDRGKLESYLFYIQNYGYPGGPASGSFQMYGHLQYNLTPVTWEQFNEIQDDPQGMYEYITPIEVNGLKGFDSQFSGQRNRYVYTFNLQGHVLSIAVSDPTPENKVQSDKIIASLQLNPDGFSDASHMILLSDPNQLYQMLIPDDWEYSFQPTMGQQISSLEVASPDLELFIDDEVEGPHSNIYYKQGIDLHVQVIDDDSIQFNPGWPDQRQYRVYFNGIEGTVYVYREPSTVEGELRSVTTTYEGKTYLLRFGYAEDADLDTIDQIISSFNITPETFYPIE